MIHLLAVHLPEGTADFGVVGIAAWIVTREVMSFVRRNDNPGEAAVLTAIADLKSLVNEIRLILDERFPPKRSSK